MFSQLDVSCVDQYSNSRYSRLLRYCGVKPAASGPASSTSAGAAPGGGGSNASSTAATPTASIAPTAAQPPAAAADPAPATQAGCRTKQAIMQALLRICPPVRMYVPRLRACARPRMRVHSDAMHPLLHKFTCSCIHIIASLPRLRPQPQLLRRWQPCM